MATLGLTAIVVTGGCAGTTPAQPESPAPTAAQSTAAPLTAQAVCVEVEPQTHFRSRLAAPTFLLIERTRPAPDASGRSAWTVRRSIGPAVDGPWTPSIEQSFILTPSGDAAIAEEINHDEKVELVYDPPLVVMPAELLPGGAPFTQQTYLRVHPLGNRKQIKAQGPVHQQIAHDGGDLVIDVVGGTAAPLAAQRLTQTFEASLKPAEVNNITHQWFVPGVGLVAEEREERTRVFGVQTRRNRESWIIFNRP